MLLSYVSMQTKSSSLRQFQLKCLHSHVVPNSAHCCSISKNTGMRRREGQAVLCVCKTRRAMKVHSQSTWCISLGWLQLWISSSLISGGRAPFHCKQKRCRSHLLYSANKELCVCFWNQSMQLLIHCYITLVMPLASMCWQQLQPEDHSGETEAELLTTGI